jgi:ComF family protein
MLKDLISVFYPELCYVCESPLLRLEEGICIKCKFSLPKTDHLQVINNQLYERLQGKFLFDFAFAYYNFRKEGKVERLIHQLKYNNCPEIGEMVGKWFGKEILDCEHNYNFDLIIPVPLHFSKTRKRGYNQSFYFAKGLSEILGVPVKDNILIRHIKNETQTKKSRIERWTNVENIFKLKIEDEIINKNILLVDDVITTGSTIESCADILNAGGAKGLSVGAIAIALA